jgi:TatD DNase family protein
LTRTLDENSLPAPANERGISEVAESSSVSGSQGPSIADLDLVDTHAHLDDRRVLSQIDAVLERATTAGVRQVISQATSASSSEEVVRVAEAHLAVFAAVGIHPNDAGDAREGDWERVVALLDHPRVVALGESGLDRYWDKTPLAVQQDYFGRHLRAAHDRDLPVVIHCRESADEILEQLTALKRPIRGVLHSFTGDLALSVRFLDLGLHLGFAGQVTFANKTLDALREVAATMPLDRLLVETDSPYLTPHPHRGRPNEPAYVALTTYKIAELRRISARALASATSLNARRLFRLPDPPPGDVV